MSGMPSSDETNDSEHTRDSDDTEDKRVVERPAEPAPLDELTRVALLGDVREVQKLFDTGRYNARSRDPDNVTALHWAAINGHYALSHFLIQSGADVNAKGGSAGGTPILWAQNKNRLAVIRLLLEHGADINITDDQGVNGVSAAVRDNQHLILILYLHQTNALLDAKDSESYTPLMRAAYSNNATGIAILLRAGADPNIRDCAGRTALNWALIKGSLPCLHKLLEYGADRSTIADDNQSLGGAARQFNTTNQWHNALSHAGYDKSGKQLIFPVPFVKHPRNFLYCVFILCPFVQIGIVAYLLATLPLYFSWPAALVTAMPLTFLAKRLLRWGPGTMRQIHKTPYLAGIFLSTLAWSGIVWFTRILPITWTTHPITNLTFAILYISSFFFHFRTMRSDPGYVPPFGDRAQTKAMIDLLMMNDIYDTKHFCIACMTRKPLRSKHCKLCDRCVARHDHHCPWVDNCIGVNNHAHFVAFLLSLFSGIVLLFRLFLLYIAALPPPHEYHCPLMSKAPCAEISKDPFTVMICTWATLQILWVFMILFVQLSQIARARTTFESMRGINTGPVITALATGSISPLDAQINTDSSGPDVLDTSSAQSPRHRDRGCWPTWRKLLGVDVFVATTKKGRRAQNYDSEMDNERNPYSGGVLRNCHDFWCAEGGSVKGLVCRKENGLGLLLGHEVDYMRLYHLPQPGMRYRSGDGGSRYQSAATEEAA